MNNDNHKHILWRFALIIAGILVFSLAIGIKLFHTTVLHADDWNDLARRQLEKVEIIYPERGDLLSDNGSVLATNLRYYTVRLDYRSERFQQDRLVAAADSLADSLALYFPHRSAKEWKEHLLKPINDYERNKRPRAWPLLSNISYMELQQLRTWPFLNQPNRNKSGMTIESVMRRARPYGAMARRSIGAVGQTKDCSEVHGIYGLEKALDHLLYGTPGQTKKINLTHDIVSWTDIPAIPGYNVRTTIDIQMQDILENELNRVLDSCSAEWGCAVLMDVKTGDIKAISNLEYNKKQNAYIEARNYAVMGFEPGSVVKPISMMIALEDGIVDNLEEVIPIGASWGYAGGRPITDSHYNSALRVREVIEQSSNIGMARIITRRYDKDPEGFIHRLEQIGFFDTLNTGIAGERPPRFNRHPSRLDLSRMCYGYASEIPPLYTLAIYNAIANNGRFVRPRLYKGLVTDEIDSIIPESYVRDRICSEANARKMQYMLKQVVWGEHGTGRSLKNSKVALAGKTGTCYSVDSITHQYNTSRKRLAFCGFFPADDPQYSCIVLTYHPRRNMFGAASTSGQVMKNIALKMYSRGMLGNDSDYARNAPGGSQRAQLYGSADPARHRAIRRAAGIDDEIHPGAPERMPEGTVPSVLGLGLREAVVKLEEQGYDVAFTGAGYVRSQQPAHGSMLAKGGKVTLALAP